VAAIIEPVKLKKNYGEHEAVHGLNLSVQAGSVCAFLGQNGAGKSSTIKMLLEMIHPTSGSGCIFGHRIDQILNTDSRLQDQRGGFVVDNHAAKISNTHKLQPKGSGLGRFQDC
jgi:ABC-2 type transport system ATP-binding protein